MARAKPELRSCGIAGEPVAAVPNAINLLINWSDPPRSIFHREIGGGAKIAGIADNTGAKILRGGKTANAAHRSAGMSSSNPPLWRKQRVIWGYGSAVVSVAAALLLSRLPAFHLESAPVSLFLCAVMFSAWFAGFGPGLLATALSALAFYYCFLPPAYSLAAKAGQAPRFFIFAVSALFVGVLSAAQRRATESLRGARDELNETVQKLKTTNEALSKSEAYLAEAQTLSQTGSFGWNVATGELLWSEESFRIFGYDRALKPTVQRALERVHPEDLRLVQEAFDGASHGKDLDLEHRLVMPDGSIKRVHVLGHVLSHGGAEADFLGAVMDITTVKNAFEEIRVLRDQLFKENLALREEIDITRMFEEIVGSSPALQAVLSQVAKVAPTESTVLITGETGTGKELIARAIHKRSQRSSRAFVSVNCAAIPRDLIASELFGHEKGAFTGATQRRLGRFESAEGGTIFLDEVGELPAETQVALLRVLQEREFQRVGGNEPLQTNVRVVAATNRDMQTAIAEGGFRNDLFYRLNVFPIEVPPLRQRKEDIPLLVEYFVDRYASKTGKKITGINKRSLELLQSYTWPGNIRELQNVIERSVIVCDSENLSVDQSWLARRALPDSPTPPLSEKLAAHEKEMIEAALSESNGRVSGPSGAAAKLGIPQSTLDSKIKSLRINKQQFRK
jgi:DNA-binding NtrC family response regulator/PAS domain-containing protein